MARARYQNGSVGKRKTKAGQVWYLRITHPDGMRRRIRLGSVSDLPTKAHAERAATEIRKRFNATEMVPVQHTFRELVTRYVREEMPTRYSTAKSYRSYLDVHILPRWGECMISEVKAMDVRAWLLGMDAAPKSKGHYRDLMRTLFRFAMLWEWVPFTQNPMSLFRLPQSTMRRKKPTVLSPDEFHKLLARIPAEPYRTMVLLAAGLGLRCSELFALQWQDFDFHAGSVKIMRAIVDGRVGDCKTEHSGKKLPLHPQLAKIVLELYRRSEFKAPEAWIFASPFSAGAKPHHTYKVQQRYITPAAAAAGLGHVGWHTFRHSYRAWLDRTGAPIGVQKDLLRHADIRTTMNLYGDSFMDDLRKANEGVVDVILQ